MLVILSVIAFAISSMEGVLAGIVVIFIGFLMSFFRDDIKRFLGVSFEKKESTTDPLTERHRIIKIQKYLVKRRWQSKERKLRKQSQTTIMNQNMKKQNIAKYIVELSTSLLGTIDCVKSCAIQLQNLALLQHYETIYHEVHQIREDYRRIRQRTDS